MQMLEFIVDRTGEEYFILRRMLCPECRGRLELIMQALEDGVLSEEERRRIGTSRMTDWMLVECENCGFKLAIRFHKSSEHQKSVDSLIDEMGKAVGEEVEKESKSE